MLLQAVTVKSKLVFLIFNAIISSKTKLVTNQHKWMILRFQILQWKNQQKTLYFREKQTLTDLGAEQFRQKLEDFKSKFSEKSFRKDHHHKISEITNRQFRADQGKKNLGV